MDIDYLIRISEYQPGKFLDEYQELLACLRHCPVHITTIHYAFCRAGINVKRIQRMAMERDPVLEGHFIARIAEYPAHYLVAVDEMSKDDRTYARLGGRAPIGQRAEMYQPFVRKQRYTVIGAMALDEGMIAARVLEGSSDHQTFYDFLENDLMRGDTFISVMLILS
ncbi:unnamed protein product [Mycena citricolor]|uniref:Transposase n=1 Tax=Mycena citricolor TaxID=2018698 RepID=A0AAD2HFC4_9AGAR|nr:unnamed protein product [Mycena citricolor]